MNERRGFSKNPDKKANNACRKNIKTCHIHKAPKEIESVIVWVEH